MARGLSSLILFGVLMTSCQSDPPLEVAQGLDLRRLEGRWYEIAKLPRPSQEGCTATTATYTLESSNELRVTNECVRGGPGGVVERAVARAVVTDPGVPAKLSLDFGFAYGDYWVVEMGEQGDYVVVGHPTRDYLWILSRTPELHESVLDGVRARARAKGFPTALLDYTKQG